MVIRFPPHPFSLGKLRGKRKWLFQSQTAAQWKSEVRVLGHGAPLGILPNTSFLLPDLRVGRAPRKPSGQWQILGWLLGFAQLSFSVAFQSSESKPTTFTTGLTKRRSRPVPSLASQGPSTNTAGHQKGKIGLTPYLIDTVIIATSINSPSLVNTCQRLDSDSASLTRVS